MAGRLARGRWPARCLEPTRGELCAFVVRSRSTSRLWASQSLIVTCLPLPVQESISLVTLDDVSDPPLVLHAVGSRVRGPRRRPADGPDSPTPSLGRVSSSTDPLAEQVLVHDALTGTVIQTLEGSSTSSPVRDLSVGGDGHQVAVGHESGEILLHDLRSAADSSSRPQKIAGPSSLPVRSR
jgi:WD40 repeat protein